MYTGHLVRISGIVCTLIAFLLQSGVKQGAVISSVQFCCYINKLLFNVESNGIGGFIGKMFVAAHSHMLTICANVSCNMWYTVYL